MGNMPRFTRHYYSPPNQSSVERDPVPGGSSSDTDIRRGYSGVHFKI